MSNTKVTVTYSNGSTREFIASDELEKLINEGEMFSITTMHSDMGEVMELQVSKMYAGNPVAALGNMIIMRSNAEKVRDENEHGSDDMDIVIDILTSCIKLLSDEVTSHQSGMSPVNSNWCEGCNPDNCTGCNKESSGDIPEIVDNRQFRKGEPLVPGLLDGTGYDDGCS